MLTFVSMNSSTQVPHIKDQMANLLHALASNFVACACGARVQLGEGCTGHRDREEEQHLDQSRHEHEHGYSYDAGSDTDIIYEQVEEVEDAPRGRTRERVSVREKRMRHKEKQQACALASMARFVGRDDRPHEQYGQDHLGAAEEVNLGPLVGSSAKRGVRTRAGKFGGVENVQSGYQERAQGRDRRNGEAKERVRAGTWQRYDNTGHEGDVDMRDSRNGAYESSRRRSLSLMYTFE